MRVNTRHQVVEVHGNGWTAYAVKDMASGQVWTRTYNNIGWATRRAIRENQASMNHRKSEPFIQER